MLRRPIAVLRCQCVGWLRRAGCGRFQCRCGAAPTRRAIAQQREVMQPPSVRTRAAAEHRVAHAYLRDISPYLTGILLRAGFRANEVTWLMIISAAAAAMATGWPTLIGAIPTVILVQLQMLLDWCDGEVPRRRQTSRSSSGTPPEDIELGCRVWDGGFHVHYSGGGA
jgi:hypothetical protein